MPSSYGRFTVSNKQATHETIPVVLYLGANEIETMIDALKSVSPDAFGDSIERLERGWALAKKLEGSTSAALSPGLCKYCKAELVWMGNRPYEAILPEHTSPARTHITFIPHKCSEYAAYRSRTTS